MCELLTLDHTGHSRHIWDPNIPAEVDAAKEHFKSLKSKGYIAYRVKGDGEAGEVMTKFEPDAGKVILSPPMAGG